MRAAIGARLGASIVGVRALAGGSINEAWAVALGDGRSVFVKANASAPADMFDAEVHGLAFLREGLLGVEGISVPDVIACEREYLVLGLRPPARTSTSYSGAGSRACTAAGLACSSASSATTTSAACRR